MAKIIPIVTVRHFSIMSEMASNRLIIRVPDSLSQRLRNSARLKGKTEADLVRAALEAYLERSGKKGSRTK